MPKNINIPVTKKVTKTKVSDIKKVTKTIKESKINKDDEVDEIPESKKVTKTIKIPKTKKDTINNDTDEIENVPVIKKETKIKKEVSNKVSKNTKIAKTEKVIKNEEDDNTEDKDGDENEDEENEDEEEEENEEDIEDVIEDENTRTNIILFSGDIKKIEDVEIGDQLIGDDGLVRNVIDIKNGNGKLFEIDQHGYEPYIVNEDFVLCLRMPDHKVIFWSGTQHKWKMLWLENRQIKMKSIRVCEQERVKCDECDAIISSSNVKRHYSRLHPDVDAPKKARKRPTTVAPDTQEVKNGYAKMKEFAETISDDNTLDVSVKDYMKMNATIKSRLSGYIGKCVQWEDSYVVLDPHVLGLWLGDGIHNGYSIVLNVVNDPEIFEYLKQWGLDNDADIKKIGKNPAKPYTYGISSLSKCGVAPLKKQLSEYNLVKNKHVPTEYIVNSKEVRLKVLAGMIDTDGSVCRDGSRINIVQGMNHKKLAEEIILLARSLGLKVSYHICKTQWTYLGELKRGLAINMNISGEGAEDIPTIVPRKKCGPPLAKDTTGTGYITVKEVDHGKYINIKVDGNQRFVLSNFTVVRGWT